MVKMKQEGLLRQQKGLPERIIHLPIASLMPSTISSAIPPKTSAITSPQKLKELLTNCVKFLLKLLSFNTLIRNETSGLKLTRLCLLLVDDRVS